MNVLINNQAIPIKKQFDIDIIMCCKGYLPKDINDELSKSLNKIERVRSILELYYCMPACHIDTEMVYRALVNTVDKIDGKAIYTISRELFNPNKESINIVDIIKKYTSYLSDLEILEVD